MDQCGRRNLSDRMDRDCSGVFDLHEYLARPRITCVKKFVAAYRVA